MTQNPITLLQIDLNYCSRTYGVAPCSAALSAATPRKCYNNYRHCQDRVNYQALIKTITFCEPRSDLPLGLGWFPIIDGISESSASVNIAGSDERMSALGERAKVSVVLRDMVDSDRWFDKYWDGRRDGSAQLDEGGYEPGSRGTLLSKLSARYPYMNGWPMRVVQGYIEGGAFVETQRRNYIVEELGSLGGSDTLTITGKDILEFVSNDKAVAPKTSTGVLSADMLLTDTTLVLEPSGIGDLEYPSSGRARIGSELVSYSRSGDNVTLTGRGIRGSSISAHKAADTFQQVLFVTKMRVDDFIELLLLNYTNTPAAFIPRVSKWKPEIDRWAPGVLLTTDITAPTGVNQLIGELSALGFIISWDSVSQEIGLLVNRPVDATNIFKLDDNSSIKEIVGDRREADRLSQVAFYTVQSDATKSLTELSNYNVVLNRVDVDAESSDEYGSPRIRSIPVRYFNDGADSSVSILAKRLLNRFRDPPTLWRITLDEKDKHIKLVDVVEVSSRRVTDETGKPLPTRLQVVKKIESKPGSEFQVIAQAYQYDGRYGEITENARPDYPSSTVSQREGGSYFSNNGASFFDGLSAHRFI